MLLLATAIWGWSFVVVKEAVAGYGVAAFLGLRFGIASVVLALLAIGHFNKRTLLVGAGIGVVLIAGYYCQTLGLRYATVTNSGFITSLFVVTTPIINRLLFGVKIRSTLWVAVAISLVGLYLLTSATPPQHRSAGTSPTKETQHQRSAGVPPAKETQHQRSAGVPPAKETQHQRSAGVPPAQKTPNESQITKDAVVTAEPKAAGGTPALPVENSSQTLGILLTLAAAILYGLHIALLDRYSKGHFPLTLVLGQTTCAAVLCLLIWPLSEPLVWPTGSVWSALLITGILATAVTFVIQTYVQQRLSAITSTLILTAEPVFATVSGCLLLGERVGGVQALGIALMITAIIAAQLAAGEHASTYPLDPL
jgi:drug/metabolite transporter (DMT)-like permease